MLVSRRLVNFFLTTALAITLQGGAELRATNRKGVDGAGSRSLIGIAATRSSVRIKRIASPLDSEPNCHECSLGHAGARTYELIVGVAEDEKDTSFAEDFRRVIERGFPNPAFPPSTPDTVYSIPSGESGTNHFTNPPSNVEVPGAKTLEEALLAGPKIFESQIQRAMDEIFARMEPYDTFVLYLSSHGLETDGVYKFGMNYDLFYNFSSSASSGEITMEVARPRVAIPLQNLDFSRCPSCTLMIFADTCYSAAMVTNMTARLRDRTGNVILIGSAPTIAQDWHGTETPTLLTESGPISIKRGGVFTGQFLDALADPNLNGDIYRVVTAAAARASAITDAWSIKRTQNRQVATPWLRQIPVGEICPRAMASSGKTSPPIN